LWGLAWVTGWLAGLLGGWNVSGRLIAVCALMNGPVGWWLWMLSNFFYYVRQKLIEEPCGGVTHSFNVVSRVNSNG
jgi:hypothetical protein